MGINTILNLLFLFQRGQLLRHVFLPRNNYGINGWVMGNKRWTISCQKWSRNILYQRLCYCKNKSLSIYLKKCEILIFSSLQIPQGTTSAIATSTTPKIAGDRFCGTFFDAALAGDATDSDTICTREYPFRISVNFDQDEVRLKN